MQAFKEIANIILKLIYRRNLKMHPFNYNRSFQQGNPGHFNQNQQPTYGRGNFGQQPQFNQSRYPGASHQAGMGMHSQGFQGNHQNQFQSQNQNQNQSHQGYPQGNQYPQSHPLFQNHPSQQRQNQYSAHSQFPQSNQQPSQNQSQPHSFNQRQGQPSSGYSQHQGNSQRFQGASHSGNQRFQQSPPHQSRQNQFSSNSFQNPFQPNPNRNPNLNQNAGNQFDGQMVAFDPSNASNPSDFFFNPMAMMEQIAQQIMGQLGPEMMMEQGENGEPVMMGGMIMMEPMMVVEGPDGVVMMGGGGGGMGMGLENMMMMGAGNGGIEMQEFVSQSGPGFSDQFVSRERGTINEHGEYVTEQQKEYSNSQGFKHQEVNQKIGEQERKLIKEQVGSEEKKEVEYVNIDEGEESNFDQKFKSYTSGAQPQPQIQKPLTNLNNPSSNATRPNIGHSANVTGVQGASGSSLEELKKWYREKYGREL